MTAALILAGWFLAAGEENTPALRYLRPEGGRWVLESEVRQKKTQEELVFTSRTERRNETLTLTVTRDASGKLSQAEIVHKTGQTTTTARLQRQGEELRLTRGKETSVVKAPLDAVVTSAPDWSDIFQLVARYDSKKAGRQQFAAIWFHPSRPTLTPQFSVERVGEDAIKLSGKEEKLIRYRVTLRSGGYRVWARPDGLVCKILAGGDRAQPIVLEGYEEATAGLK
jgi:hypothetical protein